MNFNQSKKYVIIGFAIATILVLFIADRYQMPSIPQTRPKITVIFIIDQFAYHYLPRVGTYIKHGIRTILDQGVSYTTAHFPHAMPGTAPGHAALSTGSYPKEHGMISNAWINPAGQRVPCDQDTSENAAIYNPITKEMYDYGASAEQVMVDGLSDQFMLKQDVNHKPSVFAISLKSRSAVIPASKLGKAIWYDKNTGAFTTSKAYYQDFPAWLDQFNKNHPLLQQETFTWDFAYDKQSGAYAMYDPDTYQFTAHGKPVAGTVIPAKTKATGKSDEHETWFCRTPQSSKVLLDLGKEVIATHLTTNESSHMLLWVSLSNFDKAGHLFGPDSLENIDLIYHLDQQIGDFIEQVEKHVGKGNALFVLTSDHGIAHIPELMHKRGYSNAHRVIKQDFISELNNHLAQMLGVNNLIIRFKSPNLYFDMSMFDTFDTQKKDAIAHTLKEKLRTYPYIIDAWTSDEMEKLCFAQDDLRNFYKQQRYPGRSGQMIIGVTPFTIISKWRFGTDHRTPYEYDTHVPLAIYWPGRLTPQVVNHKIWMLQLAPTLATLLNIEKPSAAGFEELF